MPAADGLRARWPDHLHPAGTARGRAASTSRSIVATSSSGLIAAASWPPRRAATVVAFETDNVDPAGQAGWSVTAIGQSQEVTDADEISRLEQIGLRSWAPGEREHFIRISPVILNGRQLAAATAG